MLGGCVADPSELADSSVETGEGYRFEGIEQPLLPAGQWWGCFGDPGLSRIIEKLETDNPSIAVALARYDNARAELGLAKVDQHPSINGDVFAIRRRDSASSVFVPPDLLYNDYRTALNLRYEIDFWGRVRQSVNAARAELEASAADWAAARLSIQAEAARNYFQIRFSDAEIKVLERSLKLREQSKKLVEARIRGGETTDLDLARADTELESTRAELFQMQRVRAEYFNALAALAGEVPSTFDLPSGGVRPPPSIPGGLPSQLLTRRPDIAAADRRMAATAARIGVVKASFLPRVELVGAAGLSSLSLTDFFDPSNFFGEIGPEIEVPLYRGGQNERSMDQAYANADEAVALYREAVLAAFRDVENALSANRFLDREIGAHSSAAAAAERASKLSRTRYTGGLVSYLDVVEAERTALSEERELIQAKSTRLLSTVQLVQALGGGWEVNFPDEATSRKPVASAAVKAVGKPL